MRFSWKRPLLATLPVLALWVGGCSGIHTSQSVSPGMFLLPGLIQTPTQTSPAERLDVTREPVPQVASVQ
jgi:hypothetical protein